MKIIFKIIISLIINYAFIMFLVKINKYSFISYILGTLQMGLYLGISEYIE